MADDANPSLDEAACAALDAFLAELQRGAAPDRAALIAKFPQLAAHMACVEELHDLIPGEASWQRTLGRESGPATMGPVIRDLGPFVVEAEIGRGGMGVVYLARERGLDRPVALKMILSGQLASPEQRSRFDAEAKAAARLNHPHIVSIYQAGELHGQPFLAMQYVDGPSLDEVLRQGYLAFEETARLLAAIARAVDHLHQNGIIHRDLKPSNILLDSERHPYVTDFGLAKLLGDDGQKTQTGVIIGTPSYMAPEQAAGRSKHVGPAGDIYSLGAILYRAMCGRPPFLEATPLDTLVQVLEGEPAAPRSIRKDAPPDLERICMKCLEKTPEDRYASASALADDLERFRAGEPIAAKPPEVGAQLQRWARREPALVARLTMLVLCFALAHISYYFATDVSLGLHLTVLGLLALWAGVSWGCQWGLNRPEWAEPIRYLWALADVAFFSAILYAVDALHTPVVIGFPLIVVASGLWFRVPLVWFTMSWSITAYLALLLLQPRFVGLHHDVMFLVGLAILGFVTAYQVQRVRALSRYYERRPLP